MPSTSIRKFDYDPNTRVLSVWFVASGKHYEFLDVPAEAVAAFKAAFAKGVYFNSHIRNRYAFRLAAGRVPLPRASILTATSAIVMHSGSRQGG
ncbi:hypothetical protein X770_30960 [Mesorhizobium sp. LSJC269B00]|uniref:KTSC domain-containing protein n=1 Tax=Mesorhizobium sp. LSJC269B00 TaxID=1287326 RepID=UPI0003CE15D6|nr:KTSC domain-containing protein [Mesorhizobium sp. LSJC269B00]ESW80364.1 hypothetical protein X770_30960 [Mesorhizobium sp. LSJC269B00]